MKNDLTKKIHALNLLTAEIDYAYHQASVKLGISDSEMRILYEICDAGERCLLTDVYKNAGISKQTINSAIRKLEKEKMLYVKPYKGKSKEIVLTEVGRRRADALIAPICRAEHNAFVAWKDEEVDAFLVLMKKYAETFKNEVAKIPEREK